MRKIFFFALFLTLLAPDPFLWAANFSKTRPPAQSGTSLSIERPSGKLKVGEKLLFDVYWMGLHVGLGSLEVKELTQWKGRPVYRVIAIARTNDTLSKLYPIYDEIHSLVDAEEYFSCEFAKNLKEGFYRADEKVEFDHEKKRGFYESYLNGSKKEFDIPPKAQNFLSVFYWFRTQPVEDGQTLRTVISDKGKDYEVELQVLKRENIELRGGKTLWTMEVEPKTRYREVLSRRGRGCVYFTIDADRIPVLIRISTPFGPVTGVLKGQKINQ